MKNLIGLIILIALGIIAYLFFFPSSLRSTNQEDLKDFAIKDTASVDKIFMSQPNGKKILLSRNEDGVWMVNHEFEARKDAINLILKTLHDIEIKAPVSQKTFDSVVRRLAAGATKVEFYTGDKTPEKIWYIGDASPGRTGTYMLLEKDGMKSSKPYVTHLITEHGYLSSRFFLDPILWKERDMLRTNPRQIKSIQVMHSYDTATSFRIEQIDTSKFVITNLENQKVYPLSNEIAIPYFKKFTGVYYEYIDLKTDQAELDSIYYSIPRHVLEIEMANGKKVKMKTFNMPVAAGSTLEGKPIHYHPERMYAFTSELGSEVHPIVQNLTFDPLVPSFEDFVSSTTVEK